LANQALAERKPSRRPRSGYSGAHRASRRSGPGSAACSPGRPSRRHARVARRRGYRL